MFFVAFVEMVTPTSFAGGSVFSSYKKGRWAGPFRCWSAVSANPRSTVVLGLIAGWVTGEACFGAPVAEALSPLMQTNESPSTIETIDDRIEASPYASYSR
ncbi:MAG TPA: hypothetical protein VHW69_00360 [Rhizomicrobium sp.]|jgi:hypothetical protein|nr:hypothetical protein [Rhizomicrobium sp.]